MKKRRDGETESRTGSPIRRFANSSNSPWRAHVDRRWRASAIERARSINCTAMQIFVKNNMQWFARPLTREEIRAFLEHRQRGELLSIFAHANYLINLAATNPQFHANSIALLSEELIRADQLELPFLVLHPGAHLGAGEEAGLEKIVESIDAYFLRLPKVKTRIALETTAGQGSCLGHKFEHLAYIISRVREPERLCVCLDTAHVFAAGYDISSEGLGSEDIPRIRSRGRVGTSRGDASERFQNCVRFAGGSTRTHRQRPDRAGGFSLHHARPPFPQNPESAGNAERQGLARRRGQYEDVARLITTRAKPNASFWRSAVEEFRDVSQRQRIRNLPVSIGMTALIN